MKFKEYKEIKNRRYSPKEVLAHLVIIADNIVSKNLESLTNSLEQVFIDNINNKNILEKLELNVLEKITNYWSLTLNQAMSYGYIVFNNLIFEEKEFTQEKIADMFVYVMRLYSPDNAEEFVKNKFPTSNMAGGLM